MYSSSNLTLKKNKEPSVYGGGDVTSLELAGGGNEDGRADESLEHLIVPRPAAAYLVRERFDFLHGRELERGSGYEAPFAHERVEHGRCLRPEIARVVVDTMQVQAGLIGGVWEDVLLEIVVAELGMLMG